MALEINTNRNSKLRKMLRDREREFAPMLVGRAVLCAPLLLTDAFGFTTTARTGVTRPTFAASRRRARSDAPYQQQ